MQVGKEDYIATGRRPAAVAAGAILLAAQSLNMKNITQTKLAQVLNVGRRAVSERFSVLPLREYVCSLVLIEIGISRRILSYNVHIALGRFCDKANSR